MGDEYKNAICALRFFCLSASEKETVFRKIYNKNFPIFFDGTKDFDSCNYCIGVACVFLTYKSYLVDDCINIEEFDEFLDFNHRLSVLMGYSSSCWFIDTGDEWEQFATLRDDARKLLNRLECVYADKACEFGFDFYKLINLSDFITSAEAKRLLGE